MVDVVERRGKVRGGEDTRRTSTVVFTLVDQQSALTWREIMVCVKYLVAERGR